MKKMLLIVLKTIIFFVGWAVLVAFVPDIPIKNPSLLRLWWEFVPFAFVVIFTVFFIFVFEKREIKIPVLTNGIHNGLIGAATGFAWLGSVVVVLLLSGVLKFEFENSNSIEYILDSRHYITRG